MPFKPPSPFEENGHQDHPPPHTPASPALHHDLNDSAATSAASPSGSSEASSPREDGWKHFAQVGVQHCQRAVLPAVAGEMVSNKDLREFVSAGASAGLAVRGVCVAWVHMRCPFCCFRLSLLSTSMDCCCLSFCVFCSKGGLRSHGQRMTVSTPPWHSGGVWCAHWGRAVFHGGGVQSLDAQGCLAVLHLCSRRNLYHCPGTPHVNQTLSPV